MKCQSSRCKQCQSVPTNLARCASSAQVSMQALLARARPITTAAFAVRIKNAYDNCSVNMLCNPQGSVQHKPTCSTTRQGQQSTTQNCIEKRKNQGICTLTESASTGSIEVMSSTLQDLFEDSHKFGSIAIRGCDH